MNKATFTGKVIEISPVKTFIKKGKEYSYRIVVLDVEHGFIAANYWFTKPIPPVGSEVTFTIKINSERNPNNSELFFHKINLHTIHESNRISPEV